MRVVVAALINNTGAWADPMVEFALMSQSTPDIQ
jgi:hypothetical protein